MTSSTCNPRSRSAPACTTATRAARSRSCGGRSLVAQMTVVRSSRRAIQHCASRPRSPTSATTIASAAQPATTDSISVVLPAPGAPKIPMRAPRPIVSNPSTTRIPVGSGVVNRHPIVGPGRTQLQRDVTPLQKRPTVEWRTVRVDCASERASAECEPLRSNHAEHAARAASRRAASVRSIVPLRSSRRTSPGCSESSATRSSSKPASAAQSLRVRANAKHRIAGEPIERGRNESRQRRHRRAAARVRAPPSQSSATAAWTAASSASLSPARKRRAARSVSL